MVSDVVQKAVVEVDEVGTTAAAATGAVFRMAAILPPVVFHCERPFAFFIREEGAGVTLFAGQYVQPE